MNRIFLAASIFFSLQGIAQNVGIGLTAGINARLHVAKADSGVLLLQNTTAFADSLKTRLYFQTGNRFTGGIGTHVESGGALRARLGFFTYSVLNPGSLREQMVITDDGNVGIGTVAPTATLDVNGSFQLRGNGAALGRVLTSDADGTATWQAFSGAGWGLTGNAGTNPTTNFFGTTDNQPVVFRQNNIYAGKWEYSRRNYFIGNQSGLNSTGRNNVAIGDSALLDNTTGYSNIAIGGGALQHSKNKWGLVAIGDSALFQNGTSNYNESETGKYNTGVGSKALYGCVGGHRNTALGYHAAYNLGLGSYNVSIGFQAMSWGNSSESQDNVGIGAFALDSTQDDRNVAIGSYAMRTNRSGFRNAAVGMYALTGNYSGENNVALGYESLRSSRTGNLNTGLGAYALIGNVSGSNNTAVGASSGVASSPAVDYATAVGAGAHVSRSYSVVLGGEHTVAGNSLWDNVGIGNTAPIHALDVQANSAFNGLAQLRLHEKANDFARMKFTNSATSTYWDVAGFPNSINASAQLNFYFSGIGADVFSLRGNGNAVLAGTLTQNSDARLKTNISLIPSSLQRLTQLNGYSYQWRDAGRDQSPQLGVLAQEVQHLFPELVIADAKGMLSVNYNGLVPVLINAVKEQQQTIESLEKRLGALEKLLK